MRSLIAQSKQSSLVHSLFHQEKIEGEGDEVLDGKNSIKGGSSGEKQNGTRRKAEKNRMEKEAEKAGGIEQLHSDYEGAV